MELASELLGVSNEAELVTPSLTLHSAGVRDLSGRRYYKHRTPPEWRMLQEARSTRFRKQLHNKVESQLDHCPTWIDKLKFIGHSNLPKFGGVLTK
jgi:hypothetical protein